LQYLTKEECIQIGKKHRWEYWKVVIKYLNIINPNSCLELGSCSKSVVVDGDTMGKKDPPQTYLWNAMDIPWPIKDKQYDAFVALQVWEHLKGKQKIVFKEVPRISNWAILSFPYRWRGKTSHCNINKSKIEGWTKPYSPFVKPKLVRNKIIYIFKFSKSSKDSKIKKLMEKI